MGAVPGFVHFYQYDIVYTQNPSSTYKDKPQLGVLFVYYHFKRRYGKCINFFLLNLETLNENKQYSCLQNF